VNILDTKISQRHVSAKRQKSAKDKNQPRQVLAKQNLANKLAKRKSQPTTKISQRRKSVKRQRSAQRSFGRNKLGIKIAKNKDQPTTKISQKKTISQTYKSTKDRNQPKELQILAKQNLASRLGETRISQRHKSARDKKGQEKFWQNKPRIKTKNQPTT
jgi:hypothetical protein